MHKNSFFPANLFKKKGDPVEGKANSGNVVSGLNLGTISAGQTRTVTFQAQVAPAQNFAAGTTTLNNPVTITSTDPGFSPSAANASIVVVKQGLSGAAAVSTGLTNNFLVDSFFLPLLIGLLGLWLFKSGMFGLTDWFDSKKSSHKEYIARKQLQSKISQIRQKEIS